MPASMTGHIGPDNIIARGVQIVWCLLDFVTFGVGVLLLGSLGTASGTGQHVTLMWLTLPAGALLALAGWALGQGSSARRSQAAGLVLLTLGGYASVAPAIVFGRLDFLQRLGFAQSVALASQTMTLRYHYVPTLFLAALFAFAIDAASAWQPGRTTLVLVTILPLLSLRAYWDQGMIAGVVSADMLRRERQFLESDVARAGRATLFLSNWEAGWIALVLHNDQFPGRAAACVIDHPDGVVNGTTVRFVETDTSLLAEVRAQPDTPIAHLMVSPAEAPAGTW
jgi:hypothetical protein